MKRILTMLWAVLTIMGTCGLANAASVVFLNDYTVSHDAGDIIHLGNETFSIFVVPAAQGYSKTFQFDAPAGLLNSDILLTITHLGAEPGKNYFDHIVIDNVDLGYLSDSSSTMVTDHFRFSGSILGLTGNTLTISSYLLGADYDDFEFTNLKIESVPIPGTMFLLGAGLFGLAGLRKKLYR